ncbi:MAG: 30S ribosomal protein S5 [Verrucomicrobia bacterium]|nr:30S ribosomal protein S5 [Verrucomicrobiota bacterium]
MSNDRKGRSKEEGSPKGDLQEKVLFINRCAKVVKGGRRFSFSALVVVGDGNKRVGMGFGKANEVTDAIRKAVEDGRKNLTSFEIDNDTIPHEVEASYDGAKIIIKTATPGTGVIAGSHARAVLEMLGVKDVVAKNLGGNNPCNQVRATFKALAQLQNREKTLSQRKS